MSEMPKTTDSLEGVQVPDKGPAPTPADLTRIDGAVWQVRALILCALVGLIVLGWILHEIRAASALAHDDVERILRRL